MLTSWRDRLLNQQGPVLWVDAQCQTATWQAIDAMLPALERRLSWPLSWVSASKAAAPTLNHMALITHAAVNELAWHAALYVGDHLATWQAQAHRWPHVVALIIEPVAEESAELELQYLEHASVLYWPVSSAQLSQAWSQALFFLLQSAAVRAHLQGLPTLKSSHAQQDSVWRVQGPHHSSYSLALVNRSLALGLQELGQTSSLWDVRHPQAEALVTDGQDITQEEQNLSELRLRGSERAQNSLVDEVVLYNDYPVNAWSLGGATTRVLANYAWEESGYPTAWVQDMNARLDLITVVTPLVKKILRNQGVRVPIAVVGNAVNHWQDTPHDMVDVSAARSFRFLHVSSGLARKGVDVLLKAYGQAFRSHDPVSLIIKTVNNPDNQCARLLAQYQAADRHFPQVVLIDADWNDGQMRSLYQQVDVVVMPSRAEGFGLPAAEAISHGVPVIATGFGGQVSLTARSAMGLIDYDFCVSGSHLGLPDSIWVEPRADHLAILMTTWAKASKTQLQQLASQAQAAYAYPRTWLEVAEKTEAAVKRVRQATLSELPQIAWVSTWNSPCGIATYSENLARAFYPERLQVYANTDAQALEVDAPYVRRAWARGHDDYAELVQAIVAGGAQVAIIQSQPGLMPLAGLCDLLTRLQAEQVATYVTLHNTRDWWGARAPALTALQQAAFAKATRLLVHTVDDLNRLKEAGLVENVVYFPHGIYDSPATEDITPRAQWQIPESSPVIATFGFLMPHKGQQVLLEALARLPAPYDQTHLLMLNTVLAEPGSQMEWQACQEKIQTLGLQDRVHVETQFLAEHVALQHLALADAIVFPYQYTEESASGAVRMGLATRRPVAVTPLAIFDDVSRATYRFKGTDVTAITDGLLDLLSRRTDSGAPADYLSEAQQLLAARDWQMLSERLKNLVEGEYLDDFGDQILS